MQGDMGGSEQNRRFSDRRPSHNWLQAHQENGTKETLSISGARFLCAVGNGVWRDATRRSLVILF